MSNTNTTEEIPPISPRPRDDKPTKDSKRTWIAVGIIALAILIAIGWGLTQPTSMGEPEPAASSTPTPAATGAWGQVTAAAGLPDAEPLTDEAIARMNDEWILVAFDGGAYGQVGSGRLSGPTVLYGIDPEGTTYEVVNMTELGAAAVMAWDPNRARVLVSRDGSLQSYDVATGSLAPGIDPCAGYVQVGATTARAYDGNWRIYSLCREESVEPGATWGESVFVHATTVDDRGQLVPDRGTVSTLPGRYLMLVDDTQVTWTFPDEPDPADASPGASPGAEDGAPSTLVRPQVLAHRADGATVMLDTPSDAYWCRAAGPGRGDTVALVCVDRDAGGTVVAEAPLDGTQVRTTTATWPGITINDVVGSHSCATDSVLAIQTPAAADSPVRLVVSHDADDAVEVPMVNEVAQACYGSRDGRLLVGGVEGVGWHDPADGTTTMLLETPTPTMLGMDPGQWVQGVINPYPIVFALDAGSYQGVLVDSDA